MLQQITHLASVLLLLIATLSCCQLLPAGAQNIGEQDFELELAGGAQANQFVDQPEPRGRFRRQINYPQLFAPQQQPPVQQQSNPLGFLAELGSQMEGVRTVSSLFNQATGQQPQQQAASPLAGLGGLANGAQLIGQLSELMRSTQERSAKAASDGQQSVQAAGQQSLQAAQGGFQSAQGGLQSAQGGIQSAITELGSGLQRLMTNNPNLSKDVKDLYQSVSSRLSSASNTIGQSVGGGSSLNGPIVPATNAEQLADNLAKVALKPQPNV